MAIKSAPPESDLPDIRKPLRTRPLWRLFGWGGAATIALAAVALTSQTEAGSKRLQLALAYASAPGRAVVQIPPRAAEAEAETKRLAAEVRELAADRERLTARIATLERNLEDMTGSIKQQSEQLAAARAANTPPPAPSAPATTPAVVAAAPPAAPALPALTPLAMPAVSKTAASWPATTPEAVESATEPAPLPPVHVAAAPASEPVAAPTPPPKPDYGIDLGSAGSIEALRIHWATLKANYGPLLVGLHPLATQHPKHPAGVTYRMVAGPLPNATEAAQLCARFPVTRTGCRPAKFIGVQLAEH
jgi:hypothetical protein